ncbi:MAG: GntR family transcriptional regulator, partial [Armatimonadota bacterium]
SRTYDTMPESLTSTDIRLILLARIRNGLYRPGDRIPGVRKLAAEIGINRNTVSKVCQQLQAEGVLRNRQGQGLFVSALPEAANGIEAEERIAQLVRSTLAYGKLVGIPSQRLRTLVETELREASKDDVRVAFIECNIYEAEDTSLRMQRALGCPVEPFVLDTLRKPDRLISAYPLISTTFYHLAEVQDRLGRDRVRVVALQHSPSTDSMLEIARLEPGTRIGVMATNDRTLNVLLKLVEMYHSTVVGCSLLSEVVAVEELAKAANVLVVHPLAQHLIGSRVANRMIAVSFQIEPQSLEYLRNRIARLRDSGSPVHQNFVKSLRLRSAADNRRASLGKQTRGHSSLSPPTVSRT